MTGERRLGMVTLEEVRERIDEIDLKLRDLLMQRLECSRMAAEAKAAGGKAAEAEDSKTEASGAACKVPVKSGSRMAGESVYRPEREAEIVRRLSDGVSEELLPYYIPVVEKIIEQSRRYQTRLLSEEH